MYIIWALLIHGFYFPDCDVSIAVVTTYKHCYSNVKTWGRCKSCWVKRKLEPFFGFCQLQFFFLSFEVFINDNTSAFQSKDVKSSLSGQSESPTENEVS